MDGSLLFTLRLRAHINNNNNSGHRESERERKSNSNPLALLENAHISCLEFHWQTALGAERHYGPNKRKKNEFSTNVPLTIASAPLFGTAAESKFNSIRSRIESERSVDVVVCGYGFRLSAER